MIALLLILAIVALTGFAFGWVACAVFTEATVDSRLPYHGEASWRTGFQEPSNDFPAEPDPGPITLEEEFLGLRRRK